MVLARTLAFILCLGSVCSAFHRLADRTAITPTWDVTLAADVEALAISPDGTCVAAITATNQPGAAARHMTLTTFDTAGHEKWRAAVPGHIAFIRGHAVAPHCAWAAVGEAPVSYEAHKIPRTSLLLLDERGVRRSLPIEGVADTISVSHAGDRFVVGVDVGGGHPNILLFSAAGVAISAVEDATYRAPVVQFSDDDRRILVTAFFGVGSLDRDGKVVWGLGALEGRDAERGGWPTFARWRRISPSRDAKWFAAHYAPMHGPQGGSVALLNAEGRVVWERTKLWEPGGVIAPDGSYVVVQGAPMKNEAWEPEHPDVRYWVVGRDGKTRAGGPSNPRSTTMFISKDCRSIVFIEVSDKEPYNELVVRDTTLRETFRMTISWGGNPGIAWSRESRLLVVPAGAKLRVFTIP